MQGLGTSEQLVALVMSLNHFLDDFPTFDQLSRINVLAVDRPFVGMDICTRHLVEQYRETISGI